MSDWAGARERAEQIAWARGQVINPATESLVDRIEAVLVDAQKRGRDDIIARLRNPDEALVELLAESLHWIADEGWDEASDTIKAALRNVSRRTLASLAPALETEEKMEA